MYTHCTHSTQLYNSGTGDGKPLWDPASRSHPLKKTTALKNGIDTQAKSFGRFLGIACARQPHVEENGTNQYNFKPNKSTKARPVPRHNLRRNKKPPHRKKIFQVRHKHQVETLGICTRCTYTKRAHNQAQRKASNLPEKKFDACTKGR